MTQAQLEMVGKIASALKRAGRVPPWLDHGDLVQEGALAVLRAETRYRDDRGIPFEHYASRCAKGAMLTALAAARRHQPFEDYRFLDKNTVDEGMPATQDETCAVDFARRHLRDALLHLDARRRTLLLRRFFVGVQMAAIADEEGITRPALTKRYSTALEQLRFALGGTNDPIHYRPTRNALWHRRKFARLRAAHTDRTVAWRQLQGDVGRRARQACA